MIHTSSFTDDYPGINLLSGQVQIQLWIFQSGAEWYNQLPVPKMDVQYPPYPGRVPPGKTLPAETIQVNRNHPAVEELRLQGFLTVKHIPQVGYCDR